MNVYIASHSKSLAFEMGRRLVNGGYHVASRWIGRVELLQWDDDDDVDEMRTTAATENIQDIDGSDFLVVIANHLYQSVNGTKHFEAGYALAKGIPVYIVGSRDNLYHWHPAVKTFGDANALVNHLSTQPVNYHGRTDPSHNSPGK